MLLKGLLNVIAPVSLLWMSIGTIIGLIAGSLPGLSASIAVILVLPFTYSMDGIIAIVTLVAVYVGSQCGGSFSSILIKTPGTPSAVPTLFDGYPMAQRGEARRALGLSITASAFGGIFSGIVLVLASSILAEWAIKFQSAEFFMLSLLGLSCIASIGGKNPVKALLSACLGLLVSTIGIDAISGAERFTFGTVFLWGGINFIPVMIGAYAFAEVYRQLLRPRQEKQHQDVKKEKKVSAQLIGIGNIIKHWSAYIKASIIGTVVGIIPAAGGSIAALISYSAVSRSSKHPEKFGTGIDEGIIASEAANNAAVGGTLVPTLVLGIPGGPVAAIMLAAFIMHGLIPGPLLLIKQPDLLYSIMWGIFVASCMLFIYGQLICREFSRIMDISYPLLGTIIMVLGIVGAYSLQNNMANVVLVLLFSFVGFFFEKFGYSTSSFILGLILGPIGENGMRKQLIVSEGQWSSFVTRPLSLAILMLAILAFIAPYLKNYFVKKKQQGQVEPK